MRTRGVTRRGSDQGKHDQAERVEFPFAPSERVRWRSNQLQWRAEKREALALWRVLWDVSRRIGIPHSLVWDTRERQPIARCHSRGIRGRHVALPQVHVEGAGLGEWLALFV